MPPPRVEEIIANLHLRADCTEIFRLSTDRPNIFFTVHKMQHPVSSYHDLAFIIKQQMAGNDLRPPKFLVFFNSRIEAQAGAEFLRERLAPELRDKIKWFHSGMTDDFREFEMNALLIGDVFGLAATDAAGMGINLPDVTLVVQYRVPKELSTWIQRAGQAGCNPTLRVIAVLIAEPSYFDDEKEKTKKRQAPGGQMQPLVSQRPRTSLSNRSRDGCVVEIPDTDIPTESRCEKVMDDFLNADRRPEKCRRKVVNNHFGNNNLLSVIDRYCCARCAPRLPDLCCDLCNPTYISFTPAADAYQKLPRRAPKFNPKLYTMSSEETRLRSGLVELRGQLAAETLSQSLFLTPQALMSRKLLDRIVNLAHARKISTLDSLHKQVSWAYLDSHGQKVVDLIHKFCPASPSSLFTTAPLQPRAANSTNTSFGQPKAARLIKCGICEGTDGHNRRTCQDPRAIAERAAKATAVGQENRAP